MVFCFNRSAKLHDQTLIIFRIKHFFFFLIYKAMEWEYVQTLLWLYPIHAHNFTFSADFILLMIKFNWRWRKKKTEITVWKQVRDKKCCQCKQAFRSWAICHQQSSQVRLRWFNNYIPLYPRLSCAYNHKETRASRWQPKPVNLVY